MRTVFVGPAGVGKTSLVYVISGRDLKPTNDAEATIGLCSMTLFTDDNTPVDVWDTAGQERYAPMIDMYTRDADIVVIAHDHEHQESHGQIKKILAKVADSEQTIALWQTKRDLCAARTVDLSPLYPCIKQTAFVTALKDPNEVRCLFNDLVKLHVSARPPVKKATFNGERVPLTGSINANDRAWNCCIYRK